MKKDKEKNPTPTQPETAPDETVQEPVIEPQDEAKEASIDEWRDALETAVKQRDEYLDQFVWFRAARETTNPWQRAKPCRTI